MTNVLVIVADDMRLDHLPYLPNVRRLIQEPGRTFTNARCNVALCQPNRISFFTGQNSRHHGEVGVGFNGSVYKGHDNTVGTWLDAAGYRCGLVGKYVNFYDEYGGIPGPRGWDTWRQFAREKTQEDFQVRFGATPRRVTGRYETEFLADEAIEFVGGSQPWFCYLAPKHPHSPFTPHPDDLHAWANERCDIVELEDTTSKPFWMHDLPPLTERDREQIQFDFRGRLRELSAVDRMVAAVVKELERTDQLEDTVIVFTSDNGVHQGEQRRPGDGTKGGPYDVGQRVPMVVRGPGFSPGPDIHVPVLPAEDVNATLVDIAGAKPGLPHQAGTSLRELVARPDAAIHTQRVLLHEIGEGFATTGDGITTGPDHKLGYRKLFRYPSIRVAPDGPFIYEMYDLAKDPNELVSLAKGGEHRKELGALDGLLKKALT